MTQTIEVTPPSKPFRFVLGAVLRKRACESCGGSLEIVWIEVPRKGGWLEGSDSGRGVGWESGYDSTVTVGYRCRSCDRVTKWNGEAMPERVTEARNTR